MLAKSRTLTPLVAATLLFGACSGSTEEAGDPPEQMPAVTTTVVTPGDGENSRAAGPVRLAVVGNTTFDPAEARVGSLDDAFVLDLLHDGLTTLDDDGSVQPGLAAEWSWDPAASTWTFELDPEATFVDGSEIDGEDVVGSLTRLVAAGGLAGGRLDVIDGVSAVLGGDAETISGLVAEGDSVVMTLSRPSHSLPELLSAPWFGISPADAPADFFDLPISSGAFAATRSDGDSIVAASPDGTEIELVRFAERSGAEVALAEGAVDWAIVSPGAADAASGVSVMTVDTGALHVLFAHPDLDETVRKAVRSHVDPDRLAEAGLVGRPSDLAGGDRPCGEPCAGDAEAAELAAGARDDGADQTADPEEPVTLVIDHDAASTELAERIAAQLTDGGFDVSLESHASEDFPGVLSAGDASLALYGSVGLSPTPSEFLVLPFSVVSSERVFGADDAELEARLAVLESDGADEAAVEAALAGIAERSLAIPIGAITVDVAARDWLGGVSLGDGGRIDVSGMELTAP